MCKPDSRMILSRIKLSDRAYFIILEYSTFSNPFKDKGNMCPFHVRLLEISIEKKLLYYGGCTRPLCNCNCALVGRTERGTVPRECSEADVL